MLIEELADLAIDFIILLPAHASPVTYLVRFRVPHDSPAIRARCSSAPVRVEVPPRARILVQPAIPTIPLLVVWTWVGALRFPGDPSCAFAPLYDPGRASGPSPNGGPASAALALPRAKASA